ncbi:hypothetical protein B0H11DRAFT_2353184 [Mycena galericulata]|nr:hypothetical protein B0H11DRAFT_2353184 [Mycena galericulata]
MPLRTFTGDGVLTPRSPPLILATSSPVLSRPTPALPPSRPSPIPAAYLAVPPFHDLCFPSSHSHSRSLLSAHFTPSQHLPRPCTAGVPTGDGIALFVLVMIGPFLTSAASFGPPRSPPAVPAFQNLSIMQILRKEAFGAPYLLWCGLLARLWLDPPPFAPACATLESASWMLLVLWRLIIQPIYTFCFVTGATVLLNHSGCPRHAPPRYT